MDTLKSKLVAGVVSCSLLICSPAFGQEKQPFTDIHNHWAHEQIEAIYNQGLLFPITHDQQFKPNQDITRAEFVSMLTKSLQIEEVGEIEQPFVDVTLDKWYAPHLIQAKNIGLILGQDDGYFRPENSISRAEVAVLIQRAYPNLPLTSEPIYFGDVQGIHWAEREIEYATQSDLINGYHDKSYGPNNHLTRAEAAVIMTRLLTKISKENPVSIATVELNDAEPASYTVEPGDSLWQISQKFGTNVEAIMAANQLENDSLHIGQALFIPELNRQEDIQNYDYPSEDKLTLDQQVPENTGQVELLEWTVANNVFAIGKTAKITDVYTGESFFIKRFSGANHADVEPLTSEDTATMNKIWGGPTWETRPILVEVDGRKIAAAMHNMPHDIQTNKENNFNGHTCIHFLGSTKHKDGQAWPEMQRDVQIAATHN